MRILVTGGAGYIGSHTTLALLEQGHEVVVVDNLVNSSPESIARVEKLAAATVPLHRVDLRDAEALGAVFSEQPVDAVIHFAGLKAVGESTGQPLSYYDNNIIGTIRLLEAMTQHDVRTLVFSSSATVYGDTDVMPIKESTPISSTNPYGRTKAHIEDMLRDLAAADPAWRIALLRYFNPVGAHPSGEIGEDPQGIPNNLVPFIAQVAVGRREHLTIFGEDYPTPDGTCIRDYIHVQDLAAGHVAALQRLETVTGAHAWNLGTGNGLSVKQVLAAFEKAVGHSLATVVGQRRPGDAPVSYADPSLAEEELGWTATQSIDQACADHWRWQKTNPQGFAAE